MAAIVKLTIMTCKVSDCQKLHVLSRPVWGTGFRVSGVGLKKNRMVQDGCIDEYHIFSKYSALTFLPVLYVSDHQTFLNKY